MSSHIEMPLQKQSKLDKGWSSPLGWCFFPKSTSLFLLSKRHLFATEESNGRIRWGWPKIKYKLRVCVYVCIGEYKLPLQV